MFKARTYRGWVKNDDLVSFKAAEKETDLFISATKNLEDQARAAILTYRRQIEEYIKKVPDFYTSLTPLVAVIEDTPPIIEAMLRSTRMAGVGPMASVAGAMAEFVGRELLGFCEDVIVENGGDIFLKTRSKRIIGVYAGEESPFTGTLAIEVAPDERGKGVCTSSGTVSHSLSFGKADAALIIAEGAALADAVATAAGNKVRTAADIEKAVNFARSIEGVSGVIILVGDKMGSWGEIKIVDGR